MFVDVGSKIEDPRVYPVPSKSHFAVRLNNGSGEHEILHLSSLSCKGSSLIQSGLLQKNYKGQQTKVNL